MNWVNQAECIRNRVPQDKDSSTRQRGLQRRSLRNTAGTKSPRSSENKSFAQLYCSWSSAPNARSGDSESGSFFLFQGVGGQARGSNMSSSLWWMRPFFGRPSGLGRLFCEGLDLNHLEVSTATPTPLRQGFNGIHNNYMGMCSAPPPLQKTSHCSFGSPTKPRRKGYPRKTHTHPSQGAHT